MTTITIGLVTLAALIGSTIWVKARRSAEAKPKTGIDRAPARKSTILNRWSDILLQDLQLPGKEFRAEMGARHPDLVMAFRQSMSMGLARYTDMHWQRQPEEALTGDVINRLVCEFYGFIVPRAFDVQELTEAIRRFLKQKKIHCDITLEWPDGQRFVITKNNQPLIQKNHLPEDRPALLAAVAQALTAILPEKAQELQVITYRQTPTETGIIFVTAETRKQLEGYFHTEPQSAMPV